MLLDQEEEAVQRFLWRWLPPKDIRWDYTILQAVNEVVNRSRAGTIQLWGDLVQEIVFRVECPNPALAVPHVMGRGERLLEAMRLGIELLRREKFAGVQVWTQHDIVASISEKLGFARVGTLPQLFMDGNGDLHSVHVLHMSLVEKGE